MKKIALLLLLLIYFNLLPNVFAQETRTTPTSVVIHTDSGKITIQLYAATPLHSANFLKLVNEQFYDSTLFHRTIKDFMIQGGDPDSRAAQKGQPLGNGDVGYTIPAEFNDTLFHKKGSLCAARDDNPLKASSGCQFYIVQGKIITDSALAYHEMRINAQRKQEAFNNFINKEENASLKKRMEYLHAGNHIDSIALLRREIDPMLKVVNFKYTPEQRRIYKTKGGTPHLDQGYTVFGEVTEGIEIIDKIAGSPTDKDDRPLEDIRMKIRKSDQDAGYNK